MKLERWQEWKKAERIRREGGIGEVREWEKDKLDGNLLFLWWMLTSLFRGRHRTRSRTIWVPWSYGGAHPRNVRSRSFVLGPYQSRQMSRSFKTVVAVWEHKCTLEAIVWFLVAGRLLYFLVNLFSKQIRTKFMFRKHSASSRRKVSHKPHSLDHYMIPNGHGSLEKNFADLIGDSDSKR